MTYHSQAGQDKWVHELIGDKGIFVDLGALDGIQTSNTYALELLGWTGICVEANVFQYHSLCTNRKSININKAVSDYNGNCRFGHDRIIPDGGDVVECATLNNILSNLIIPREIDYLSLDIEGHEYTVLKIFPFDKWNIKLLTVEHNVYCDGAEKKNALYDLLTRNGYIRVVEDVKCLDPNPLYFNQPFEDWYQKLQF